MKRCWYIGTVFLTVVLWITGTTNAHAASPVPTVFSMDGTKLRAFPTILAGSSVASGDINNDGSKEIIVGSPPGIHAQITVYALDGTILRRIYPYGSGVKTGINVAVGNVSGNGTQQIVVAPRRGVGPRVLTYNELGRQLTPGFWAYAKTFNAGANITTGDIDGDGKDEVVTGVGPGAKPHLSVLTGTGVRLRNYFPFDMSFRNGLAVTTADFDGNGTDEAIVAPQERRAADIAIIDLSSGVTLSMFRAFGNYRGGVNIAALRSGSSFVVAVGAGRGGGPDIKVYNPTNGQVIGNHFFAFDQSWRGGISVFSIDINEDGTDDIFAVPGATTLTASEIALFERAYTEPSVNGVSYTAKKVWTSSGTFSVRIVEADLDMVTLSVKTITSTSGDCIGNCPVHPLQYYVDQANGVAGINGSFFCPEAQASCSGKEGTYLWLWYNSLTGTFVNMRQNQFNTDPVLAFTDQNVPYLFPESRDFVSREEFESMFDVKLRALLSNGPLLVQEGSTAVDSGDLDVQQRTMKTTRVGIGVNGRRLMMFVASRATVLDLARIGVSLGLDTAINLDGGSSTSLAYNNRYMVGPGRNVPNAFIVSVQ